MVRVGWSGCFSVSMVRYGVERGEDGQVAMGICILLSEAGTGM
jgi:hypothetical protein